MPECTETVLDFRLIRGQEPEWLAEQVETLLAGVCAGDARLRYEMEVLEVRHPTRTERDEPIVTTLALAFTDLTGQPPIYGGVPGSTDGTLLHAQAGIPIVTCGPGDIHIPHHIDEWVDVEDIKTAARLYVLAGMRYCRVKPRCSVKFFKAK